MTSRRSIALLVAFSLFGAGPALALEPAADEGAEVTLAHGAVTAPSTVATPPVVRGLKLERHEWVLPAPVPCEAGLVRAPAAPVPPLVHGARPDVVTCPSQGPP